MLSWLHPCPSCFPRCNAHTSHAQHCLSVALAWVVGAATGWWPCWLWPWCWAPRWVRCTGPYMPLRQHQWWATAAVLMPPMCHPPMQRLVWQRQTRTVAAPATGFMHCLQATALRTVSCSTRQVMAMQARPRCFNWRLLRQSQRKLQSSSPGLAPSLSRHRLMRAHLLLRTPQAPEYLALQSLGHLSAHI